MSLHERAVALSSELAVDMGTVSTQLFVRGQGVVLEEPTVAAVVRTSREVVDVGRNALHLVDSQPDRLEAVWPVTGGAIADSAVAQRYLSRLLRPYKGGFLERTRILSCITSSATATERRAAAEACRRAGASNVHLIEQTVASALGGELPVHDAVGTVVVVAGAGITEAALMSLGCVVASSSVRGGVADVDGTLKHAMRREYGMLITDRTAEEMKLAASELARTGALSMIEARGKMVADGSTATALLERDEVQSAVDGYIQTALQAVRACLVQAPPELAQDLFSRGIHLAGGGALLSGLPEAVTDAFGIRSSVMPDPERAAVVGAGKCLEAVDSLKALFVGGQ